MNMCSVGLIYIFFIPPQNSISFAGSLFIKSADKMQSDKERIERDNFFSEVKNRNIFKVSSVS